MENCSGFVNVELFERALEDFFDEKVEVVGFRGTTAVLKGDNYTSDTYKVTVTFKRKKGWVFVTLIKFWQRNLVKKFLDCVFSKRKRQTDTSLYFKTSVYIQLGINIDKMKIKNLTDWCLLLPFKEWFEIAFCAKKIQFFLLCSEG